MKTLATVTAHDLMRSPVITLPEDATISEALALFEDEGISGVPIVDESGRVSGLLSQDDVARGEHLRQDRIETGRDWSFGEVDPNLEGQEDEILAREDYTPHMLGQDTVSDWMSTRLVQVPPSASLREVCEVLRREGVHRALVMDRGRLRGIVTSSDIVAWLADNA